MLNDKGTTPVDFSNIYVTQLNDTATIMNEKLNQGLHLVISPEFIIWMNHL